MPKPRAAKPSSLTGSGEEGGKTGGSAETKTSGRGKRPVPLPRRLSSLSSPTPSVSSVSSQSSSPRSVAYSPYSPSQGSPSHFFKKSNLSSSSSGSGSSPRRKSSGVEVPTPTANFKSYRRVVGGPGPGETEEPGRLSSHGKGPAPLPTTAAATKLKSVTRLSFEHQPPFKGEDGSPCSPVRISVKADYKKPSRRQNTGDRQQQSQP